MLEINFFDMNGLRNSPIGPAQDFVIKSGVVGGKKVVNGVSIFTDRHIVKNTVRSVNCKVKIAWLLEPKIVYGQAYSVIVQNEKEYNYIFTYDESLLKRSKKYIFVPGNGTWIPYGKVKLYDKTKNISMILSKKKQFEGHRLRHQVYSSFKKGIDYYGTVVKYIPTKDIGLRDYRFSIVVENCRVRNYFTEKILDCFNCGTIPIYWGCPNIGDFFDMKGIFTFNGIGDLKNRLVHFNANNYKACYNSVKNNFERAKKYFNLFDYIYNKLLINL